MREELGAQLIAIAPQVPGPPLCVFGPGGPIVDMLQYTQKDLDAAVRHGEGGVTSWCCRKWDHGCRILSPSHRPAGKHCQAVSASSCALPWLHCPMAPALLRAGLPSEVVSCHPQLFS